MFLRCSDGCYTKGLFHTNFRPSNFVQKHNVLVHCVDFVVFGQRLSGVNDFTYNNSYEIPSTDGWQYILSASFDVNK